MFVSRILAPGLAALVMGCTGQEPDSPQGVRAPEVETVSAPPGDRSPATPCNRFGAIDRDRSGIIDGDEYAYFGDASFHEWDSNRDREISAAEFARCGEPAAANATLQAWDSDQSGSLGRDEFFPRSEFVARDIDGDGELAADEWRPG